MTVILDQKLKTLVEEFLRKLAVEFESVEFVDAHAHPFIHIRSNDSGLLIGANGETLRALNLIVRKIVTRRMGENEAPFLLDVNGYHRRKIEELKQQAFILAERVKTFRSDVEMSPMNSYERMVVHSLFSDDSYLNTESVGEGKFRRVVLKYINSDVVRRHNDISGDSGLVE
jgi:spoIIIJ-associated protein